MENNFSFTTEPQYLIDALSSVDPKRPTHTVPHSECVLITLGAGTVSFLSGFGNVLRSTSIYADGVGEGSRGVHCRRLLDAVKTFAKLDEVSVALDGDDLTLGCGDALFRFASLPGDEFDTPKDFKEDFGVTVRGADLVAAMKVASGTAGHDGSVLDSIHISLSDDGEHLEVVGTDGRRMAKQLVAFNSEDVSGEMTAPIVVSNTDIESLAAHFDSVDVVRFSCDDGRVQLSGGGILARTSPLADAGYPNYRNVLSSDYLHSFAISAPELRLALRRAKVISERKTAQFVALQFAHDGLRIFSESAEIGSFAQTITDQSPYAEFDVWLNADFLSHAIPADAARVILESNGEDTPVRIREENSDTFQLLAPLKVAKENSGTPKASNPA